jgi:putative sugar O-methyltransferase
VSETSEDHLSDKGSGGSPVTDMSSMEREYVHAESLFHPSVFWEKLRQKNIHWLSHYGFESFKRTVNNNYFNWMVSLSSPYLYRMLLAYLKRNRFNPKAIAALITTNLSVKGLHTTYISDKTRLRWIDRKLYAIYLLCLNDYVEAVDTASLFYVLQEPLLGDPIAMEVGGRRVSQDICNSYLEYAYFVDVVAGIERPVIAEIGGGYGRLFYVIATLMAGKSKRLIMIDIPPALHLSQWYLSSLFPDLRIFMWRPFEDYVDVAAQIENSDIAFLLPHQLQLLPDRSIDLLINISSFQEMNLKQIHRYYELIDVKARNFYTKQWLHWNNPEDNTSMPAVVYPTRPAWNIVKAGVNPVHKEFFEAIFEIP